MLHFKCVLLPLVMLCSHHMTGADIDRGNCAVMTGPHGYGLECNRGYVGVSMCLSVDEQNKCGSNNDSSATLVCCKDNTHDPDVGWTCLGSDINLCQTNKLIGGICNSVLEPLCFENQYYNWLTCCDGHDMNLDRDNAFWVYADYGQLASCPDNTVGCGYCKDSDGIRLCNNHGIYCCPYLSS